MTTNVGRTNLQEAAQRILGDTNELDTTEADLVRAVEAQHTHAHGVDYAKALRDLEQIAGALRGKEDGVQSMVEQILAQPNAQRYHTQLDRAATSALLADSPMGDGVSAGLNRWLSGSAETNRRLYDTLSKLTGQSPAEIRGMGSEEFQGLLSGLAETYPGKNLEQLVQGKQDILRERYGYKGASDGMLGNGSDRAITAATQRFSDVLTGENAAEVSERLGLRGVPPESAESLPAYVLDNLEALARADAALEAAGHEGPVTVESLREAMPQEESAASTDGDKPVVGTDGGEPVLRTESEEPAAPSLAAQSVMNAAAASVIGTRLDGERLERQIGTIAGANAERFADLREDGMTKAEFLERLGPELLAGLQVKQDWNAQEAGTQSYEARAEAAGKEAFSETRLIQIAASAIADALFGD